MNSSSDGLLIGSCPIVACIDLPSDMV